MKNFYQLHKQINYMPIGSAIRLDITDLRIKVIRDKADKWSWYHWDEEIHKWKFQHFTKAVKKIKNKI